MRSGRKPGPILISILFGISALSASPASHARHGNINAGDDAQILANCPNSGDTKSRNVRALNLLKRRMTSPDISAIDSKVTLAALTQPGDDSSRWDPAKGATIQGYVADVKVGGVESVNCHTRDPLYRDTHIEVTIDPLHDSESLHVIVEVTPQWRTKMKDAGVDWSTPTLKRQILGHWISVTGWLLFDAEHANASANTASAGARVWRATAWEIHPITKLEVLKSKPAS